MPFRFTAVVGTYQSPQRKETPYIELDEGMVSGMLGSLPEEEL